MKNQLPISRNLRNGSSCLLFKLLSIAILCSLGFIVKAQSGTYTIVKQPCNYDGELSVTITGLTPPLNYTYYTNNGSVVHTNVNSLTDVLTGIGAPIVYVGVVTTVGNDDYAMPIAGWVSPFLVDKPITTDAVCPDLTGEAQITINGGTTPASVQWYESFPTTNYFGTGNPMSLPPGTYSYIVSDANGCKVEGGGPNDTTVYIRNISNIQFSVPTTTANCTNGTAAVDNITGGLAPYTYLWSNGATSASINGLSQGLVEVAVTDAQGCYSEGYAYIQQAIGIPVNPVVTDATCLQNDGSILAFASGGQSPYTFSYSNGMSGQSISGLSGGTYLTITARDANGCIGTKNVNVNSSSPITVTYSGTNSSCTSPTGSATLAIAGGTDPYTVNWNTSPAATGITLNNMYAGTYSFSVSDAVGCVRTGTVLIQPTSVITADAYSDNPVCPASTGTVGVNVTGTAPPFTYLWNTGATTESISNAPIGFYSCLITDNAGCTQTKYQSVDSLIPINIGFASTMATCLYSPDGNIVANAVGGTAPYYYIWSNGQTGATATGLTTGNYYVYVQDADGCAKTSNFVHLDYNTANDNCYCTITGKVYKDANENCIQDAGEEGIEHIMIHCSGFGYGFTDANGVYSFQVPSGTYTLSESVQSTYPLASCQINSIEVSVSAASACSTVVDFANTVIPIRDMHIVRTSINNAIPGNPYTQGLIIQNDGTIDEATIQLGYRSDGQLPLSSISPAVYSQIDMANDPNWHSVESGFPVMTPGSSTIAYFTHDVPTNIPIGTSVLFKDTTSYEAPMSNWLVDYTPWNNVSKYTATVIGSFDPNFKEVSPAGTGPEGFILTSDSVLDYIVHFQNSGSYYAEKVVVVDNLDANLDWTSLKLGYSDHAYTATISENGVLVFTFNNIHLTWQSQSEMASRGLVSYSIKQKPGLLPGTQIKNSAGIYFDYNEPVITNQTLNTIQDNTGITEGKKEGNLIVYPNPVRDELTVNLSSSENAVSLHIYDLQGRLVKSEKVGKNSTSQKVAVGGLVNGLYLLQLEMVDGQKVSGKFIKN